MSENVNVSYLRQIKKQTKEKKNINNSDYTRISNGCRRKIPYRKLEKGHMWRGHFH